MFNLKNWNFSGGNTGGERRVFIDAIWEHKSNPVDLVGFQFIKSQWKYRWHNATWVPNTTTENRSK